MYQAKITSALLVSAVLVFAGCGRQEGTQSTTTGSGTTTTSTPSGQTGTAAPATPTTPTTPAGRLDPSRTESTESSAVNGSGSVTGMSSTAIDPATVQATPQNAPQLLEQAQSYIRQSRFDQADTIVKKLETIREQLPTSLQRQLDTVRSSLNAARNSLGTPGSSK